jgi:uncharacterized protein YgiM (DUF1202 family)
MPAGRRYWYWIFALLVLSNREISLAAEAVLQKATVFGTPVANLRAGPGVEHALKSALKEGDTVSLEKLEGDWFLVVTSDGQQGYIHKNLLKPNEDVAAQSQVLPPQATAPIAKPAAPATDNIPIAAAPVAKAAKAVEPPAARVEIAKTSPPDGKAPSLLQMLEGRESEAKIALLVAAVAFVMGWFCGGHYYIRREHKRRRRLSL